MQDHEHRRTVEEYRDRILRGELPPIEDVDLAESQAILERHDRPTGVNVRLADGRTQAGDLVLATAGLPPVLRARALARWHARQSRSVGRQARREPRLRRLAVAHSRAAAQPCGARLRVARPRGAGRPGRRAGSSSSTSSADPGGDGESEPPPPPRPSAEAEAVAR